MPGKDHLKDLLLWLREGGISSLRRLTLTLWEASETHKEGDTLNGRLIFTTEQRKHKDRHLQVII